MKEKISKQQKQQKKLAKKINKYQRKKAIVLEAQKQIIDAIALKLGAARISMKIQSQIDEHRTLTLGAEIDLPNNESINDGHNKLFAQLTQSMTQFL